MFRSFSGSKSHMQDLTLLVVSEFDQWNVLVYGPGVTIHGHRQFAEGKAKDHALAIAKEYIETTRHEKAPEAPAEWAPTGETDWLAWRN